MTGSSSKIRTANGCLFTLAIVSAIAWSSEAATPEESYDQVVLLIDDLILGEDAAKIAAAQQLAQIRASYSVPALAKALEDPSASVRKAAVEALAGIATKPSAKALAQAANDENQAVALAAINALGDMHFDDSYQALTKLLSKVKDAALKKAVLEGIKKWNKPYTPLPAPIDLPDGKDVPQIPGKKEPPPGPEKAPEEPGEPPSDPEKPAEKPEKKPPAVIGTPEVKPLPLKPALVEPDVDSAFGVLESAGFDVASCIREFEMTPPMVPLKVTVTAGGGVSQILLLRELTAMATECIEDAIVDLEFPPAGAAYALEYEFSAEAFPEKPDKPEPGAQGVATQSPYVPAPPLMLELTDLTQTSSVAFDTSTSKFGSMPGRTTSMSISGGWTGKWIGFGATIPFSGATALPLSASEDRDGSWIMNNLGMWIRHTGLKSLKKMNIRWGFSLSFYLPTGTSVSPSFFDLPGDFTASAGALYAGYYRAADVYPNLEKTFKVGIAPMAGVAVDIGPLSFQLDWGFDFVVLGEAQDPDTMDFSDIKDVSLMNLGFGAALRPLPWLQLSLELTSVFQVGGKVLRTPFYDDELLGVPISHEVFITPGLAIMLPVNDWASGHFTLGLRVPLDQIGGYNGNMDNNMQLEPILLLGTGFRWGQR
jgi:hypothetical protein